MTILPPTYRRLLRYLRPYVFPHLILAVAAMLILSASSGAIPFLAKGFINQLTSLKSLESLRSLSLAILAVFVVRAVANFGSNYLTSYLGQKIVLDVRSELNDRLQQLPLSFFNRTPSGVMVSRVVNDVGLISSAATDGIFSVIGDGSSLVALIAAALYIDWTLALAAFRDDAGHSPVRREHRQPTKSSGAHERQHILGRRI